MQFPTVSRELVAPAVKLRLPQLTAGVLSELLAEIDCCNFKNHVHDALPDDDSYQDFLLNVWSEGLSMQNNK